MLKGSINFKGPILTCEKLYNDTRYDFVDTVNFLDIFSYPKYIMFQKYFVVVL